MTQKPPIVAAVLMLAGAANAPGTANPAAANPAAANPAAALCMKDGAKVEIEKAADGSESGTCVFPSGERIKEWAYFRNKHRTSH